MDSANTTDSSSPLQNSLNNTPPFVREGTHASHALAQWAEYLFNIFKYQHRTFTFAVYVCKNLARLFYYDRTGVFVSEAFVTDVRLD